MYTTTKAERETILRWDEEDKRVILYTASPATAAKWKRLGYDLTHDGSGWTCMGYPGCVTVRKATKTRREVSPAALAALAAAREAKKAVS